MDGMEIMGRCPFFRRFNLDLRQQVMTGSINTISRCDNYVQFSAKICIIFSTQFHSLINGEGLEIFHPLFSTSMRKVRSVNRMVECTSVEKTRLQKG